MIKVSISPAIGKTTVSESCRMSENTPALHIHFVCAKLWVMVITFLFVLRLEQPYCTRKVMTYAYAPASHPLSGRVFVSLRSTP